MTGWHYETKIIYCLKEHKTPKEREQLRRLETNELSIVVYSLNVTSWVLSVGTSWFSWECGWNKSNTVVDLISKNYQDVSEVLIYITDVL